VSTRLNLLPRILDPGVGTTRLDPQLRSACLWLYLGSESNQLDLWSKMNWLDVQSRSNQLN